MFTSIKIKLAHFVIKRKFSNRNGKQISYKKIISGSQEIFIIMPKEDGDFYHALILLKFYLLHKKRITLFLPDHKYNLIPEKEKYRYISFLPQQITKLYLPDKKLVERLQERVFDALIDLNRSENVFYSAVSSIINAKLKAGFVKGNSERYYNLLFQNRAADPESSYRNLLNSLQMF